MNVPKARKLASGTWFIQLRLGGESIPVSGTTEKAVTREALRIKAEYKAGARVSKGTKDASPTIGEAIERYIRERENVLSPVTIRAYEIMQKRLEPYGWRELGGMKREDWQLLLNELAAKYKPKTLKNTIVFLRSAVESAGGNVPKLELPQAATRSIPFLKADEIETFVKAVAGTDIAVPALLALSSLRLSEIRGLRWENIPVGADFIRVDDVMVLDSYNVYVPKNRAKNVSSARNVPIPGGLHRVFHTLPATAANLGVESDASRPESGFYGGASLVVPIAPGRSAPAVPAPAHFVAGKFGGLIQPNASVWRSAVGKSNS